jgi:transcriptional regulator with XRE-family HTH domain
LRWKAAFFYTLARNCLPPEAALLYNPDYSSLGTNPGKVIIMKKIDHCSRRQLKMTGKFYESPSSHHIGLCLRRLREIQKMSQSELARRAKTNLTYVSTIENHPSNMSINKLMLLCNGMQVPAWLGLRLATIELERSRLRQLLAERWQQVKVEIEPGFMQVADQADY